MPPKQSGPSKKTEAKRKEKVIDDKTFGLKNKKGGKAQKYISQVEKQVKQGGDPRSRKAEEERIAEKKRKDEAKKLEDERKNLFRPVTSQKVEQGVDPKSVFCAFFKQGLCKKGDKCKFSHDPEVQKRSSKRSIYCDTVDVQEQEESMLNWDDAKLADVVKKKHSSEASNRTDIICRYFLEALEQNKYGWFWHCPNGGEQCRYRHAIPHGFVLKKDKAAADAAALAEKQRVTFEELLEEKRAALSMKSDLTPVTIHSFLTWKKRKLNEKATMERNESERKKEKYKTGHTIGLSGREMFSFDPSIANDLDGETAEDEENVDLSAIHNGNNENDDDSSTVHFHEIKFDEYGIMKDALDHEISSMDLKQAVCSATVIDEELFNDEDLDELEDHVDDLKL